MTEQKRMVKTLYGFVAEVTITDDPKREGMLIGRYQSNIPRVMYGKKWQQVLRSALEKPV